MVKFSFQQKEAERNKHERTMGLNISTGPESSRSHQALSLKPCSGPLSTRPRILIVLQPVNPDISRSDVCSMLPYPGHSAVPAHWGSFPWRLPAVVASLQPGGTMLPHEHPEGQPRFCNHRLNVRSGRSTSCTSLA